MPSFLRLFCLILIVAQSINAKTSTENLIVDKSELFDITNPSLIKEGNFLEDIPSTTTDYIWVVSLKKGPYASKEEAIKAQLDLKKILDPLLTDFIEEVSLVQKTSPPKNKNINDVNISWMINFEVNVYKSKVKALDIIKKIEKTQKPSDKVLLTRKSIDIEKHKLAKIIQPIKDAEIFLSQEISSVKVKKTSLILITTRGSSLNVRKHPSSSSPVIAKLLKGTKVPQATDSLAANDKKGWFYIEYAKEKYGWISSSFSKKIIDSSIENNQQAKLTNIVSEKNQKNKGNQIESNKPSNVFKTNEPISITKNEKISRLKEFKNVNATKSKEIKSLQLAIKSLRSELNQTKLDKSGAIEGRNLAREELQRVTIETDNKVKNLNATTASIRAELAQTISDKGIAINKIKETNAKEKKEILTRVKKLENKNEKNSKKIKSLQTKTASLSTELNLIKSEKTKLIEAANQANAKASEVKLASIKEFKHLESSKNQESENLKSKIKNLRIVLEKFKKEKLKSSKSIESNAKQIEIERIIRDKEITALKKQTMDLKLELDKSELNRIKIIEEINRNSKKTQIYKNSKEGELNQVRQIQSKEVNELRVTIASLRKKLEKLEGKKTNIAQKKSQLGSANLAEIEKDSTKAKRKSFITKPTNIKATKESAEKNDTSIEPIEITTSNLYNWVNAWKNKNIKSYLSFYSKNFKDSKRSRSKWETYKRRSLRTRSNLFIEISDIKVRFLKEDLIKTTFVQKYESKRVSDIGVKDIYWKKERNGWKIIKEVWRPL